MEAPTRTGQDHLDRARASCASSSVTAAAVVARTTASTGPLTGKLAPRGSHASAVIGASSLTKPNSSARGYAARTCARPGRGAR